jgi:exopolyphosphatase
MRIKERLKSFFEENKRKIKHGEITIALGNEGCDLDSFISSLVVAYAESAIHVVNMKKEVFMAKGELVWVCKRFGIEVNDLIFLERPNTVFSQKARRLGAFFDVGGSEIPVSEKKIRLMLTDHNEPVEELKDCEVELIIDHHPLLSSISSAKRIYLDLDVGSATTLISKYLGEDLTKKNHCAPQSAEKRDETLCKSFAHVLLIPILVDTHFLKRRTSIFDVQEYKKLKKIAGMKKRRLKKMVRALKKARKNDHCFETRLILQKDFKRYYYKDLVFGASTVKFAIEDWVDREARRISGVDEDHEGMALMSQLDAFRKSMGLDFYFVGTKIKGVRNMIFCNFTYLKQLIGKTKMKRVEYKGMEYYDVNKKLTRKLMVPSIMDILDKHSDDNK